MIITFSLAALLATGLFAGASLYIQAAEHPARLKIPAHVARIQWRHSYLRAAIMQMSLAVIGFAAAVGVWRLTGDAHWLAGAVLLIAVVPYTFIFIMPTNRRLMDTGTDLSDGETFALLAVWIRLHAVRSVLSVAALLVMSQAALS